MPGYSICTGNIIKTNKGKEIKHQYSKSEHFTKVMNVDSFMVWVLVFVCLLVEPGG